MQMQIGTDVVDIQLLSGSQASALVPLLWQALTPQRRLYMVWDSGHLHGPDTLARFVGLASQAVAAWVNDQFLGISWVIPLAPKSRCGLIHLGCTGPRWQAEAIGRVWIRDVLPDYFDCLLAFLPVPFRHIRAMIQDMGFREISLIPGGACLTMRGDRIVDALLYQRDL